MARKCPVEMSYREMDTLTHDVLRPINVTLTVWLMATAQFGFLLYNGLLHNSSHNSFSMKEFRTKIQHSANQSRIHYHYFVDSLLSVLHDVRETFCVNRLMNRDCIDFIVACSVMRES